MSVDQVEEWANAIECREDIGFSTGDSKLFRDITFELANSKINRPLSKTVAAEILSRLSLAV